MSVALTAFHATYGQELGLNFSALMRQWQDLLDIHYARFLRNEISMQDQRRERIRSLFLSSRPDLSVSLADRLFGEYERYYREAWTPYPDVKVTLGRLKHFILGTLSNGDAAQQTEKLRLCGLLPFFTRTFASSEIGFAKPAPEAFGAVCKHLGVQPDECVYVGDRLDVDARASFSAGLRGVWLDRAGDKNDVHEGISVIDSLKKLPPLLAVGSFK